MRSAIVVGRRGQGKTTLAVWIAKLYHRSVMIFDPNAQHQSGMIVADAEQVEEALLDDDRQSDVIVFRPSIPSDDFTDLMDRLARFGNYSLVIDEASSIQSAHKIHPSLELLLRQGPREDDRSADGASLLVTVIQTTHRPIDLHGLSKSLATDAFIFALDYSRDLEIITEQWGEEVAAIVRGLPRWHFVHIWEQEGRRMSAVWADPEEWGMSEGALHGRWNTRTRGGSGAGRRSGYAATGAAAA